MPCGCLRARRARRSGVRHWGRFPQQLEDAFPGVPVICLDLPGNGILNRLESPPRVEAMADYCRAEIARRGIATPCRLLAMSLGAMVAVAWAQHYPGDVAAAVLVNTSLRPFSPFHHRLRPSIYPRLLRLFGLPGSGRQVETAILRMTTRRVPDPDAVIEEWLRWRQENPVSRRNALIQLLAAARYRAPRQRPLQIHAEGGHDLPLDDQAWVLQRIRDWLELVERDGAGACARSCNGGAIKT